jgi:predicted MPP superfamily phosphohydrolase
MGYAATKRARLAERISSYVTAEKPLHKLAENWTARARKVLDEATSLTLERVEIHLRRLPERLDGFRIVHLTDIHHSPLTSLEYIERAVRIANRLRPDMFVLTGDYVSHETEFIAPAAAALGKLKSRLGTFACLGNHDHWTDAELVTHLFRGEGINMLVNEGRRIETESGAFWIAGVDDYMVGKTDLKAALTGSYPDEFKLLLAHNPIIFRQAVRARVDLTLSGHTHGGQIRLRDSEKGIIPRRRKAGLHRQAASQLYISRGIGTVVVPVRYQCPPEISLLTLRRS